MATSTKLTKNLLGGGVLSAAGQRKAWLEALAKQIGGGLGEADLGEAEMMRALGSEVSGVRLLPLYTQKDYSGTFQNLEPLQKRWLIAQTIAPARGHTNKTVRAAVAEGAERLVLEETDGLADLLAGVDGVQLALRMPRQQNARALLEFWKTCPSPQGCLNVPAESGARLLAELLEVSAPKVNLLAADGVAWHERGASATHELAAIAAGVVAALRAWHACKRSPAEALARVSLSISADSDFFLSVAKLRALRILWAQIAMPLKLSKNIAPQIHVLSSPLAHSVCDPWTNLLRASSAALAVGIAGCDSLALAPATIAEPHDSEDALRLARHAQTIIREESRIGDVADATAGSWYVETFAERLAQDAWGVMQTIEKRGGLESKKARSYLEGLCRANQRKELRALARGEKTLIGVNDFIDLDEAARPADTRPTRARRLAEEFEELRARVQKIVPPSARPICFLVVADAEAGAVAKSVFTAGGIACKSVPADVPLKKDVPPLACVALGKAKGAAARGADALIRDLRKNGARAVYVVGARVKGADGVLLKNTDRLAFLRAVHKKLSLS